MIKDYFLFSLLIVLKNKQGGLKVKINLYEAVLRKHPHFAEALEDYVEVMISNFDFDSDRPVDEDKENSRKQQVVNELKIIKNVKGYTTEYLECIIYLFTRVSQPPICNPGLVDYMITQVRILVSDL